MNCHVLALLTIKQSMIWYDRRCYYNVRGKWRMLWQTDRQTDRHRHTAVVSRRTDKQVVTFSSVQLGDPVEKLSERKISRTPRLYQHRKPLQFLRSQLVIQLQTHTWLETDKQTDVGSSTTNHCSSSTLSLIYSYRHTHVTWDKQTDRHGHNEGCGVSIQ